MKKPTHLKPRVAAYERKLIRAALVSHKNDIVPTAAALGIDPSTIRRKLIRK